MDSHRQHSIPFMPDGRPCPGVMTSDEVILFLRLDGHGERCLKYYRDENLLTGIRIGRRVRYPLDEVLRFINQKVKENRHNGLTGQMS